MYDGGIMAERIDNDDERINKLSTDQCYVVIIVKNNHLKSLSEFERNEVGENGNSECTFNVDKTS